MPPPQEFSPMGSSPHSAWPAAHLWSLLDDTRYPARRGARRFGPQTSLGGNAMASQTPDRSDRGVRYPSATSQQRQKLRLVAPGAPQFEKRPIGTHRRERTGRLGEPGSDDEPAAIRRVTAPAGRTEEKRAWITRLQA